MVRKYMKDEGSIRDLQSGQVGPANAATLHVLRYCPLVAIIVDLELDAALVRVRLERRLQASAASGRMPRPLSGA